VITEHEGLGAGWCRSDTVIAMPVATSAATTTVAPIRRTAVVTAIPRR